MANFGQFSQGPIQFGAQGQIQSRGTVTPVPPSAQGNYNPAPAASPSGGGVLAGPSGPNPEWGGGGSGGAIAPSPQGGSGGSYGMSGNGSSPGAGPGGFDSSTGTAFFDDGGEVPESDGTDPEQGAQSATLDPMAAVKAALAHGRQSMGLPVNFTTGEQGQPSFDDGGMVPNPSQGDVTAGGNGVPDPRNTLKYLTGDGAVSPDVANALERHIDPQGQMDPAHRTLAAVSSAPTPEAQFGMLQHYRTRYNAFTAAAKAAMDQGNAAQAAVHATQAFDNLPSGYSVKFAPARGGIAMMASKAGGQPQPQQALADGGEVEDPWQQVPESENVEDRRDEEGGDTDGGVLDSADAYNDKLMNPDKPAQTKGEQYRRMLDKLGTVHGFDDGGMVPDPEDAGDTAEPDQDTDDAGAQDAPTGENTQPSDGAPRILTVDQFKQLLSTGYDKPLDDGLDGVVDSVASGQAPSGQAPSGQAAVNPPLGLNGAGSSGAGTGGGGGGGWKGDKLTVGGNGPPPDQQEALTTVPKNTPAQPQAGAQQPQQQQPQQLDEGQIYDKWNKLAQRMFPWAAQGPQREKFIQAQMARELGSQDKINQENAKGKMSLETLKEYGRNQRASQTEEGRNERNVNSTQTRERIAQQQALWRTLSAQQQQQVSMMRTQIANDPSLARDPNKLIERVQQLSAQIGLDPQRTMSLIRPMAQQPSMPGQQQGQPQQQQPSGGGQQKIVVFPKGPYAGKPMIQLPSGNYVPYHQGQ